MSERRGHRLLELIGMGLRLVRTAAPRLLVVTSALQVMSGLAAVGAVILGGRLAERLVRVPEDGPGHTTGLLIAFLAVTLVALVATSIKTELQRVLSERSSRRATDVVLAAVASAELADYESAGFHDQMIRALASAMSRPVQLSGALLGLISAGVTVVGLGVTLVAVSPLLLVLVALGAVPLWWTARRATQVSYDFNKSQSERDRKRSYLMSSLAARTTAGEVRVFGIGHELRRRIRELHTERLADMRPMVRSRTWLTLTGAIVSVGLAGAVIVALIQLFDSGAIAVDQAVIATGAFLVLTHRLQALASSASSVLECALFLEDLETFAARARSDETIASMEPIERIELDRVSFTYPAGTEPAVRDIELELRPGELVALVGENGSGKSTLARLITLLYEPSAGDVRVNGKSHSDLDPRTVRSRMAVVQQEYMRLLLTARENIGMGDIEAIDDTQRAVDAARFAQIDSAISALPDGYETLLGTEYTAGQELSGGQWQRLAIARAWFRDADVIVFDEPTSALDPKAEVDLIERMSTLAHDKLIVLISHRFGTVARADRIVVMHEGAMVETGTHRELMELSGVYASLYRLQASTFLDEH